MREEEGIRVVKRIIDAYSFEEPLAGFLKKYFRDHSQMGSRDRRQARSLCFNYFRIGNELSELSFEKRLAIACFLCEENKSTINDYLLKNHSPFVPEDLIKSLPEKINLLKNHFEKFDENKIFSQSEYLSERISSRDFNLSFLKKPRVWIRIREKYLPAVKDELEEKGMEFHQEDFLNCLSFENEIPLDKTESYKNGYFEIQDKNSQRTASYFKPRENEKWWDACCGSGGKSLLLAEENPSVNIFATDKRAAILKNYRDRMQKTGFRNFEVAETDLSNFAFEPPGKFYDGIIADVPCTGTGTWARTPEYLIKKNVSELIEHFVPLQRRIITNVLSSLKANSPLVYITCSVLKDENEENVDYFLNHLPLKLENSEYLEGYTTKGDTLFIARFLKIS